MSESRLDRARRQAGPPDFTQVFEGPAPETGALAGLTVAVKDLFDVAGYRTGAGSLTRADLAPAPEDSTAVARLRAAGAGLVGHTTMTEFAYSGLGLNPHHGTPQTPLIAGAIAGGSTSGGASAVARGVADIALGTDTGGSIRIPAAFCGLYGVKPTASEIPQDGASALSHSLDSIGAMARDIDPLVRSLETLRADPYPDVAPPRDLIVPENFGLDDLDPAVARAFDGALAQLERRGYGITRMPLAVLERYRGFPVWHLTAVEARAHYAEAYDRHRDRIDPRVATRMARADEIDAPRYVRTLLERQALVAAFRAELGGRAIVLPSVAILPPSLAAVDVDFDRLNLLALRNTSLANVMDGCAVSIPLSDTPGTGIMLTAAGGEDAALIAAMRDIGPGLQ